MVSFTANMPVVYRKNAKIKQIAVKRLSQYLLNNSEKELRCCTKSKMLKQGIINICIVVVIIIICKIKTKCNIDPIYLFTHESM